MPPELEFLRPQINSYLQPPVLFWLADCVHFKRGQNHDSCTKKKIKILFRGFPGGLDRKNKPVSYIKIVQMKIGLSEISILSKLIFIVMSRSHLLSCAYKSFALLLLSYKLTSILMEL